MKKTFLIIILMTAAAITVFGQSGTIRELTGDVQLKPAGAPDFVPAKSGDTIAQNTIVSTGFKSSAIIAVGGSVITVRPLTRLSLAEIQSVSGAESLNVNLQTGRVKVDVKPPAGTKTNFKVQGPTATASVRGTSFEFDGENLSVYEGTVSFEGNYGAASMVYSGDSAGIGEDGTTVTKTEILPPAPVGAGEGETVQSAAAGGETGGSEDKTSVNLNYR